MGAPMSAVRDLEPAWAAVARDILEETGFPGCAAGYRVWSEVSEFQTEVRTLEAVLCRLAGHDPKLNVSSAMLGRTMVSVEGALLAPRETASGVFGASFASTLFRPEAFDAVAESAGLPIRFPARKDWALDRPAILARAERGAAATARFIREVLDSPLSPDTVTR